MATKFINVSYHSNAIEETSIEQQNYNTLITTPNGLTEIKENYLPITISKEENDKRTRLIYVLS